MDGKHLKDLRRQLNLSQAELAGPEVTRNLISLSKIPVLVVKD